MGFALSDMQVSSPAFTQRGAIPRRHTGEGEDLSPELNWSPVPEGTRSRAVFCHDPDAPLASPGSYGFVHWLVYNLPADARSLAEDSSGEDRKSTRLNSSHVAISYAVFCLKKKT